MRPHTDYALEKVTSADGTSIAYLRKGKGAPLILVPGSGTANPVAWTAALPALEAHFTVYALYRRGRGESGDAPDYAIAREFEDVAALVNAVGEPAYSLGHSFGALCALEAALLTQNVRKLILYEPAMPLPGLVLYPKGMITRLQSLLDAGDREGLLRVLYCELVMMSQQEFEQFRNSPTWPERLASAHLVVRESEAEEEYEFEPQRFERLQTPTLLLLGGDSPPFLKQITETLHATLPNSQIALMPGQQHTAMYSAPQVFTDAIVKFLTTPG